MVLVCLPIPWANAIGLLLHPIVTRVQRLQSQRFQPPKSSLTRTLTSKGQFVVESSLAADDRRRRRRLTDTSSSGSG
jgi:hypothetical protein